MKFSDIPNRTPGPTDLSWWNSLKLAGQRLESLLGGGLIIETSFTIANNQSSFADVTGLSFDPTLYRSFVFEYQIYRNTTGAGATELAEKGSIIGVFSTVAGTWEWTQGPAVGNAGITDWNVTNAGQVQYKSSNITGTPATSQMKFKATTMGV